MRRIGFEARGFYDRFRGSFGDAADIDLRARGARAFSNGVGHLLDMTIARIIEHQYFGHEYVLPCLGRVGPPHLGERRGGGPVQALSTSTSSLSSIASTSIDRTSRIATPSRGLASSPFTRTRPSAEEIGRGHV